MNRLKNEKSPYLKQHATNPINWYPWCEEAFKEAKNLDKPIFLSIGYSTCHWCHVMAEKVFENKEIANLINENFIPIKIDKEERKDIDKIYMLVCQIMTGSGGWPLTIFITPEKKPFFAATYIPPEKIKELISQIIQLWKFKRNVINDTSEKVVTILNSIENIEIKKEYELNDDIINFVFDSLYNEFDLKHGGFGKSQKFPDSCNLRFLLSYYKKTKNEKALGMALKTLESIRLGGIYDQIEGGIHRYTIDEKWLIPHFEKTLYDQALISDIFLDAYKITEDDFYYFAAIEILDYVKNNLMDNNGGFYSGEDALADYYLWEYEELPKEVIDILEVSKGGNFIDEVTGEKIDKIIISLKNREKLEKFKKIKNKLFLKRKIREKPEVDRKILTDWNSLMTISFLKAYKLTNNSEYLNIAEKNINFLLENLCFQNKVYHRYIDGEISIDGYIDDYIFLIDALKEFKSEKYKKIAEDLLKYAIDYFWDNEKGGFFYTSSLAEVVLIRKKEFYDSIIPSANSRAYKVLEDKDKYKYKEKLKNIYSYFIPKQPTIYTEFLAWFI